MLYYNQPLHHRRSLRLKGYDYSRTGFYFVTVCVNRMGDGRGEKFFAPNGGNRYVDVGEKNIAPNGGGRNRIGDMGEKFFAPTNAATIVPTMPFGKIMDGKMILNEHGKIVEKYLLEIPQHFPYAVLREFVVMPNHIHGIIELTFDCATATVGRATVGANNYSPLQHQQLSRPHGTSRTIGSIIRGFKIGVTKQLGYSVWQRNYWEHIIRNEQSYRRIADYIMNNPMNWENDKFYTVI